jgi:hypothetical protein
MQDINNDFKELIDIVKQFKINMSSLEKKINKLEKKVNKENKKILKNKKKRKPSGFAKPQKISKELCDFLNVDENTKMSRTEVTKILIKYIKDNQLFVSNKIILNDKLKKIFIEDNITFFTLQKYMNVHYL